MTHTEIANYDRGRSYSWKLDKYLYRDILHDSFLYYYLSKGLNLFEQHPYTVIRTIKLTFWGRYISRRYVKNRKECFEEFTDQALDSRNPEDILIEKESFDLNQKKIEYIKENINLRYPRTAKAMAKTLDLKLEGYRQDEIAEELGVPKSLITYYFKNIKNING